MEAIWIAAAFALGAVFRLLGLPPLIGYLIAGFVLNGLGLQDDASRLAHIAHLGVLLLLFTVGLKLRLKNVLQPVVWAGGLIHLLLTALLFAPIFYLLGGIAWETALLLAIALGFSSTVVAAKVLEAKHELRAFHGRIAIGILIIQDLVAVGILSFVGGHVPSPFALGLLTLPLLRPLLFKLLDSSGHEELLVLFGLLLAIVLGGLGFEYLGLSSELGALVLGTLLAEHPRAKELADSLWSIKEILLIGFFLQIGMAGLPTLEALGLALGFILLLPLKTALFFFILLRFRLRARSSFLTGLSLASYSEFGLIVANIAMPDWIVPLAVTVALSFVIAAPINRLAHNLYARLESRLDRFELDERHPDEQPVSLGKAHILIMGMGQIGTSAYDFLKGRHEHMVGLDSDFSKVQKHLHASRRVLYADAEDPGFWQSLKLDDIRAVMLTMSDTEANTIAATQLRRKGFTGVICALSQYAEDAQIIQNAGADRVFSPFNEIGVGLAEHLWESLYERDTNSLKN